ncbi:hypothetical protein [Peptoniphilus duerdenii]|uniref:hypothetical protein n=1 Tax=Peptoniphilus duerdenii TaxID=507750 RepID=UPI002889DF50|nr:hypothetical protein [Peptoniphilus duerdenii]
MLELVFITWLISLYSYNKIKLKEIKKNDESGMGRYRDDIEKLILQNFRAVIVFYVVVFIIAPFIVALINN